ncbi:MAG: TRAP transporter small permease subunit [Candidatus Competibacteraceae bacterium]|nr:TRAP transporter small permease subunit [Candidatus Competibacteraceae bacterium]
MIIQTGGVLRRGPISSSCGAVRVPKAIKLYVKWVDAASWWVGHLAMYLVFLLLGILAYATVTKVFFVPANWTVEMAQFVMVAYYLLGGAYSLQHDEHVRMDLLYGRWSIRGKATVDLVTDLAMIFFLVMLLVGGIISTLYAYEYGERNYSAWRPYMLPIKLIMSFGILLALLQAIAIFFKDWAKASGREIS